MNRSINLRLFAFLLATAILCLHTSEALAQRKLVPLECKLNSDGHGPVCSDSMFVEEGTLPPGDDSCNKFMRFYFNSDSGYYPGERLLYSNHHVYVVGEGSREHAEEFQALDRNQSVLDSTHYRLLSAQVLAFLKMFGDSVGFAELRAGVVSSEDPDWDRPNNRFRFSFFIKQTGMYNIWAVRQFWAASVGVDTTDYRAVYDAQYAPRSSIYLPECFVLVSVSESERAAKTNTPLVSSGAIRLSDVLGRYTLLDISGRVVAQGNVLPGDVDQVLQASPGVYVLLTATGARTILVLP